MDIDATRQEYTTWSIDSILFFNYIAILLCEGDLSSLFDEPLIWLCGHYNGGEVSFAFASNFIYPFPTKHLLILTDFK